MRRRNITIRGNLSELAQNKADVVAKLQERYTSEPQRLRNLMDYLLRSGWDERSIESASLQASSTHRPAVEAFTIGHGHVFDQVILNQGTYTHMQDTQADPNFALRFRGETELILRRLTPGDLLMLQAVHSTMTAYPETSDDDSTYWAKIWQALHALLFPSLRGMDSVNDNLQKVQMFHNQYLAAAFAFDCVLQSPEAADFYNVGNTDLYNTFMRETSRFYVGVVAQRERLRVNDDYVTGWNFRHVQTLDHAFMAAVVCTCYAIDNWARKASIGDSEDGSYVRSFIYPVQRYASRMNIQYTMPPKDETNGDPPTQQPS